MANLSVEVMNTIIGQSTYHILIFKNEIHIYFFFLQHIEEVTTSSGQSFNFNAITKALQIAHNNTSQSVLNSLQISLGNLLLSALKDKDYECATELIKAGANVNFEQIHIKMELVDAFVEYFQKHCTTSFHHVISNFIWMTFCKDCSDQSQRKYPWNITKMNINFLENHLQRKETPLSTAVNNNDVKALKLLLENGAQINHDCGTRKYNMLTYDYHQTSVSIAIKQDHPNIIAAFVEHGLNINAKEYKLIFEKCSDACLLVLLKAGLHHKNMLQTSSLAIAAGRYGGFVVPIEHHEKGLKSLKFVCRQTIRLKLLQTRKENLIYIATTRKLLLPNLLCQYIICDVIPLCH